MPVLSVRRQAESAPNRWFQRPAVLELVNAAQRQTVPELTRVFGHQGLYLRPGSGVPAALSGNLLGHVVSLYREQQRFSGDFAADDAALPVLSGTQTLVVASFVLETSPDAAALIEEFARVLRPEGNLHVLTLNPWCPRRLQWAWQGVRARSASAWARELQTAGLEVLRQRAIGPWAFQGDNHGLLPDSLGRAWPAWRLATLTIARRRDPGLTPIRRAVPSIGLPHGLGAG